MELTFDEPQYGERSERERSEQIDSTKLKDFERCPRYFFFRHVLGWELNVPNHDLYFGTSVHAAMEHLLLGGMTDKAVAEAIEVFNNEYRRHFPPETDQGFKGKNPANVAKILAEYAAKYRNDRVSVLHTEVGGVVPITPEIGLTFRIDAILERDGKIFVRDFKTSSAGFSWWQQQWRMSTQIGTYLHVAHCLYGEERIGGFEIDGLLFKEPLKNGESRNEIVRVTETKTAADMDAWLERTVGWINDLRRNYDQLREESVQNNSMIAFRQNECGCVMYNRLCKYWSICSNYPNPLQIRRVPPDFHVNFWDPLAGESNREIKTRFEEMVGEANNEREETGK